MITEEAQKLTYDAFKELWESPKLPLTTRRKACGAVFAAGVRQGDEIFDRKYMEFYERGEPIYPDEEINGVFEKVARFVVRDRRLRPQYLQICLRIMVKDLERNHQALKREYERQLSDEARKN